MACRAERWRLLAGSVPATGDGGEDDAAVERAAEVPLSIARLRRGTGAAVRVQTHDEVVAPVERGIGQRRRDVDEPAVSADPHPCAASTRRNANWFAAIFAI